MQTVREILDILDEFLAQGTPESQRLWDVITALRGPENDPVGELKSKSVAHIRRAAFPKTAAKVDESVSLSPPGKQSWQHFGWDAPIRAAFTAQSPFSTQGLSEHEGTHMLRACIALRLH